MTEIVVIGGTGTIKQHFGLYRPLLEAFPSIVPAHMRYLPLRGGLRAMDNTLEHLRTSLRNLHLETPPIIVGHSQGSVHAIALGLEGLASAVVGLGGPHRGLKSVTPITRISPVARELAYGSQWVRSYHHALATRWPAIPLHVVCATVDQICPRSSQFGLEIAGNNLTEWVDSPRWLACPARWAGVKHLHSTFPSEHITLPLSTGVRWLVNQLQTAEILKVTA